MPESCSVAERNTNRQLSVCRSSINLSSLENVLPPTVSRCSSLPRFLTHETYIGAKKEEKNGKHILHCVRECGFWCWAVRPLEKRLWVRIGISISLALDGFNSSSHFAALIARAMKVCVCVCNLPKGWRGEIYECSTILAAEILKKYSKYKNKVKKK